MAVEEHDRIELAERIDAPSADVWRLISEPGWFINEGALVAHRIEWPEPGVAVVIDDDHGSFTFHREGWDPPRYAAFRGIQAGNAANARLIEFWVTDLRDGAEVRLAETGFASMDAPVAEQIAQYEQNTRTWQQQLAMARQRLESGAGGALSA